MEVEENRPKKKSFFNGMVLGGVIVFILLVSIGILINNPNLIETNKNSVY